MDNYLKFKIKNYKYWTLYLHENQGYLGRCYVWCNRKEALDLPDAAPEEQNELFEILKEVEKVWVKVFGADMLNYAFLGNVTHHLHGHIIPRYSKDVEFEGLTFKDDRWGKNYLTDRDFKISEEITLKIKDRLIAEL